MWLLEAGSGGGRLLEASGQSSRENLPALGDLQEQRGEMSCWRWALSGGGSQEIVHRVWFSSSVVVGGLHPLDGRGAVLVCLSGGFDPAEV